MDDPVSNRTEKSITLFFLVTLRNKPGSAQIVC